ncbi:MAG: hypothetical protein VR70_02540 [Rhodospirillaceae bacterium BRH_c57]|nr:MAG: hypothetical protein VR70_02540 [Rhodospirillaceae bacterium BRH_c57]
MIAQGQYEDFPAYGYAASKLILSEGAAESGRQFSREVLDRSRTWGDRQPTSTDLDRALRALISILKDTRPVMTDWDRHMLARTLRPFADHLDDVLLVERHLPLAG